jgi:hypothetical protein
MKRTGRIVALLLFFSLLLSGLPPLEAAENADPSEWTFSTTSYVWFSGLNGTLGVKGHKARVSLSFSDVLSNMDASGMLTFQGHKGKQYFFFDGMYLSMSAGHDPPPGRVGSSREGVGVVLPPRFRRLEVLEPQKRADVQDGVGSDQALQRERILAGSPRRHPLRDAAFAEPDLSRHTRRGRFRHRIGLHMGRDAGFLMEAF